MADLTTSTASALSAVDLSKLKLPDFLAEISYESVLAEMLDDVNQFCIEKTGEPYIFHEADPAYIIVEAGAYKIWRDRLDYQNQVKNMLVAYAQNEWLDHLGANPDFKCPRLVIVPADETTNPPTPAVMESDDAYRARMVLSNEGYSTAGSGGGYFYHAMSADGDVRDVDVYSPEKSCTVYLTVLSHSNGGVPSQALLNKVYNNVSADKKRPLTDYVITRAASVIEYSVSARLTVYPGAGPADVIARATAAIRAYCDAHYRLGHDITRTGLIAAATVVGVQNVELTTPSSDLSTENTQARRCVAVTVTVSGVAL